MALDPQKLYQLEEFKRRHQMGLVRKSLQSLMLPQHQAMWWCRDEALQEMRAQFVASTNHCVVDDFLGPQAFAAVAEEVT